MCYPNSDPFVVIRDTDIYFFRTTIKGKECSEVRAFRPVEESCGKTMMLTQGPLLEPSFIFKGRLLKRYVLTQFSKFFNQSYFYLFFVFSVLKEPVETRDQSPIGIALSSK